ncbi:MAG: sulfurtransferase [Betaproteobacteria bacterium]|nr:sulfurtransferase [Betaproteobacteria bacterium]
MPYRTLIRTAELSKHLGDPNWVIIDCRHELTDALAGRAEYRRSHIAGAHFMDACEDLAGPLTGKNGRHPLPDADAFAERLSRLGVDSTKQVVAYDAQAAIFASRLWWMLRWLGHDAVAVLDGGWSKWLSEARPVGAEVPTPSAARFIPSPRKAAVNAGFVLASLGRPEVMLLDARSPDRFRGENETLDPVGGHIPGAANRFFRENLAASGLFKSAARLREEYSALLQARRAEPLVHYCGSGVSACHNMLAMEIAGLPAGMLYAGSWSEWCADPSRPRALD